VLSVIICKSLRLISDSVLFYPWKSVCYSRLIPWAGATLTVVFSNQVKVYPILCRCVMNVTTRNFLAGLCSCQRWFKWSVLLVTGLNCNVLPSCVHFIKLTVFNRMEAFKKTCPFYHALQVSMFGWVSADIDSRISTLMRFSVVQTSWHTRVYLKNTCKAAGMSSEWY
jgi:hypothetical protein